MKNNKTFIAHLFAVIRSYFFSGLLIILPFALTVALLNFSLKLLTGWLQPIHALEPQCLKEIPHSEIIIVVLVIFLTGMIVKLFFLEPIIHFIESIFFRIPLMRAIYGGIKQLIKAFTAQDEMTFQKVVYVQFPYEGNYSLGFLTSALPEEVTPQKGIAYVNVFVPTTPNPTSGFLIQVPENKLIIANLTRHEAMSLIISGGIVKPERFN